MRLYAIVSPMREFSGKRSELPTWEFFPNRKAAYAAMESGDELLMATLNSSEVCDLLNGSFSNGSKFRMIEGVGEVNRENYQEE